MTFLEKAKELFPKMEENIITRECPEDFKLETESICKDGCISCWNREMPNTETKAEILKEVHEHFGTEEADISYVEGLEHGRNDAWEFMKKLWDMKLIGRDEVFGYSAIGEILDHYTPQEAIAKLKAYEEAQNEIKVGDVVYHDTYGNGVMTREDEDYYNVLLENGDAMCIEKESVTKTGKHLEIKAILEQIGE